MCLRVCFLTSRKIFEPAHDKTNKMACAPREDRSPPPLSLPVDEAFCINCNLFDQKNMFNVNMICFIVILDLKNESPTPLNIKCVLLLESIRPSNEMSSLRNVLSHLWFVSEKLKAKVSYFTRQVLT